MLFIAVAIAGYTLGQADILRKAMGKKIPEQMKKQQANFIAGARADAGSTSKTATAIWDQIEPFAGYGFNKAHAACYAFIAYQTAYLKANYPSEYMCAVLESASGDMDKVATAIAECRRLGIPILPPDVNRSESSFTIETIGPDRPGGRRSAAPDRQSARDPLRPGRHQERGRRTRRSRSSPPAREGGDFPRPGGFLPPRRLHRR